MAEQRAQNPPSRSLLSWILFPLRFLLGPATWENVFGWVKIITVVLCIEWLWFQPFLVPSGSMEPTLRGDPRFFVGDRVAVNKHRYGIHIPFTKTLLWRGADPKRWDIVVFYNPEKNAQHPILVKRLVGLPGEHVHIAGGKVYINGKPLKLPADMPHIYYTSGALAPKLLNRVLDRENCPPDQRKEAKIDITRQVVAQSGPLSQFTYGVLLDDKHSVIPKDHYFMLGDNSADSADGRVFGWVPRHDLIGPVFCIFWPIGHARDFTGFTKTWWGKFLLFGLPALFVLYETISASLLRSWRVAHAGAGEPFRKGDHILVNQLAFGLRLPFLGVRVTSGRLPRLDELVFYFVSDADGGRLCAGRVAGLPGDRVATNPDAAAQDAKSRRLVPPGHYYIQPPAPQVDGRRPVWVAHEDLVGSVVTIWWPLRRARSLSHSSGVPAQ